jgi:hypothetical protein
VAPSMMVRKPALVPHFHISNSPISTWPGPPPAARLGMLSEMGVVGVPSEQAKTAAANRIAEPVNLK